MEEGAAVLVALGLDLLGEPPAAWHPVVWYGKLIRRLKRATPKTTFLSYCMVWLCLCWRLLLPFFRQRSFTD